MSLSKEFEMYRYDNQFSATPFEQKVSAPLIPGIHTSRRLRCFDVLITSISRYVPRKRKQNFRERAEKTNLSMISYECYKRSNYNPDCILPLRIQRKLTNSYKHLRPAEKYNNIDWSLSLHKPNLWIWRWGVKDWYLCYLFTAQHPIRGKAEFLDSFHVGKVERHPHGFVLQWYCKPFILISRLQGNKAHTF